MKTFIQSKALIAAILVGMLGSPIEAAQVHQAERIALQTLRMRHAPKRNGLNQKHISNFLETRLPQDLKFAATELAGHILELCHLYQLDPAEVLSLIDTESSFKVRAISKFGARGLMQVMPKTAIYIAKKARIKYHGSSHELFNPYLNLHLGIAYLAYLKKKFPHTERYLAAYNLGPTTVAQMVRQKRFTLGPVEKYVKGITKGTHTIRKSAAVVAKNGI